jgi:O-antigen ligase
MLMPLVSIISFITLVFFFVLRNKWMHSFNAVKNDRILWIFIGYYLIHVLGLIYSENMTYGLKDIQTKMSFILVPVVFSGFIFKENIFRIIKSSFIFSSVISLVVLLSISYSRYIDTGNRDQFFYTSLSHGTHVTYLTIYLNLALLFVQEKIYFRKSRIPGWLSILIFIFIFTGVLMLSARTSTVVAMGTLVMFPVFTNWKRIVSEGKLPVYIVLSLLMPVMFAGYLQVYNRFVQVQQEITLRESSVSRDTIAAEAPNSTNIRINLWKNAIQLIKRNPVFGVGTGDLKEELVKVYQENNYEYGVKIRPSPHNQFLHTAVILGLVGVLFLSALFFFPLYLAFKHREWLYFFFLVIIILNCMTESVLEREAGVLFFAAFNMLFYIQLKQKLANPGSITFK